MGTVEKYPLLVFFITFRDPKGHDSTVEKHVSQLGSAGACQGRRITNPPQVGNLPHLVFIAVLVPQAHQDRSEICPTRQQL